jgi:hypothetical protein
MQSPLEQLQNIDSVNASEKRQQMPFYNQSDVLYQQDDQGTDTKGFISKFSVLKSPSIDAETNRRESVQTK